MEEQSDTKSVHLYFRHFIARKAKITCKKFKNMVYYMCMLLFL